MRKLISALKMLTMSFCIIAMMLPYGVNALAAAGGDPNSADLDAIHSDMISNPAVQVFAGKNYTLVVREDGTVSYAGDFERMRRAVSSWENVESVDGYFAHMKDGKYTSTDGLTNLPVSEEPITFREASAGNWAALLPDGTLLYSTGTDTKIQFSAEDSAGYGLSEYKFKDVVFGSDSYFGLLPSGRVVSHCPYNDYNKVISAWKNVKSLCFYDGLVPTALTNDGRVLATDASEYVDTSIWRNVEKLTANHYLTIGLCSDGTVLATGGEYGTVGFLDTVSAWTDIADVVVSKTDFWENFSPENTFVIGLKKDGTVVTAGDPADALYSTLQRETANWTDIVQIDAGEKHVVCLKSDGTVVAAGDNSSGQCNIIIDDGAAVESGHYREIIQTWGGNAICALRFDGTVAVTELYNDEDENYLQFKANVEQWRDINKLVVIGGLDGLAGIKTDGHVELEITNGDHYEELYGDCREWSDIVDIVTSNFGAFGLKKDGTVVATESTIRTYEENFRRKLTFDGWKEIKEIQTVVSMNGDYILLGLADDDTLYYSGSSYFVHDWNGIQNVRAIDCSGYIYLVLFEDGTLDFGGINAGCMSDRVYSWEEIVQIKAGEAAAAGIKRDGTVVADGEFLPETIDWERIRNVYFDGNDNLYGVCEDGTVKICISNDSHSYFSVDCAYVETWQEIEKLALLTDYENDEIIIVGFLKDGSIVSTRDLSL